MQFIVMQVQTFMLIRQQRDHFKLQTSKQLCFQMLLHENELLRMSFLQEEEPQKKTRTYKKKTRKLIPAVEIFTIKE